MSDWGTYERTDEGAELRFERLLRHPIDRVWAALTKSEHIGQWFAEGKVDARLGGLYSLVFTHAPGHPKMSAVITVWEPPNQLEFSWEGDLVNWSLTESPDGTRLVLTHRVKLEELADTMGGWHFHLDLLAQTLEHGRIEWPKDPFAMDRAYEERLRGQI